MLIYDGKVINHPNIAARIVQTILLDLGDGDITDVIVSIRAFQEILSLSSVYIADQRIGKDPTPLNSPSKKYSHPTEVPSHSYAI